MQIVYENDQQKKKIHYSSILANYNTEYKNIKKNIKQFIKKKEYTLFELNPYLFIEYSYDKDNEIYEQRYYDGYYQPYKKNNSEFAYKYSCKYSNGLLIEEKYENSDSSLWENGVSIPYVKYYYDEKGRLINEEWYRTEEKNPLKIYRFKNISNVYDLNNNIIEVIIEYNSMLDENQFFSFIKTMSYDDYHHLLEESIFDLNRKPIEINGIHKKEYKYDKYGYQRYAAVYNMYYKLTSTESNYSIVTKKYDQRGNIIEFSYFDENENPCLIDEYYHKLIVTYNANNILIHSEYRGINGELVNNKDGFAYQNWTDDVPKGFFKSDGEEVPVLCFFAAKKNAHFGSYLINEGDILLEYGNWKLDIDGINYRLSSYSLRKQINDSYSVEIPIKCINVYEDDCKEYIINATGKEVKELFSLKLYPNEKLRMFYEKRIVAKE